MRYVFADCILDTRLYTLCRGGTTMRLRPKAFHVLQYLLEHRDHVVSKDELCTHVWPGQFISDATIEGCIALARRAIGDSGRGQRLIESRRGYGYRFVGSVQAEAVSCSDAETAPPESLAPGQPPGVPRLLDAVGREAELVHLHRSLDTALTGARQVGDEEKAQTAGDAREHEIAQRPAAQELAHVLPAATRRGGRRPQWNSARNAGRNRLYAENANEVHTAHSVDQQRI